jgi:hypothetical protein
LGAEGLSLGPLWRAQVFGFFGGAGLLRFGKALRLLGLGHGGFSSVAQVERWLSGFWQWSVVSFTLVRRMICLLGIDCDLRAEAGRNSWPLGDFSGKFLVRMNTDLMGRKRCRNCD